MPQDRKQKSQSKFKKGYLKSPDKLERTKRALSLVDNKVPISQAAAECNLSYGYSCRRVTGEVKVDSRNGPSPVLNTREEEEMAKRFSEMARKGMGLTPKDFLQFIKRILPVRTPGVQVENTSSVSPACRKRRLKGRRYIAIVADTA